MISDKELANIIFPDVTGTIEDLEKQYPCRNLKEGAEVTRFAPSPTGFLHTGSLFTSLICHKVANQTGGVFYVRLEDTDTKREIQGSGAQLLSQLKVFNIVPNEGYYGDYEQGNYGPYIQSKRADIYRIVIKHLLEQGKAYPCFCTSEDLDTIRNRQEAAKLIPGYYGQFAKCRFLTNDERAARLQAGEPFVIRFKSSGNHVRKIKVHDLIHGDFEIAQNDQDIVIYKSDGLPTYHFAHACDDHFMRTTTVIRGEEWISSLPIHVELFEALGWKAPNYAHLPVIMKIDETTHNKRKLSKRHDSEAAVSYFLEDGYPAEALIMYLMTIANSNFEEWIFAHKFEGMNDFEFSFEKMSLEGALFDMGKVNFFSREILAKKSKNEIVAMATEYAKAHKPELLELINRDVEYFGEIMNIEREKENPRKDYEKFGNLHELIAFFYEDKYEEMRKQGLEFNAKFDKETITTVLTGIKDKLSLEQDEQSWFANMKAIGEELGFSGDRKAYKANPEAFKGMIGDVAEMLRITLTTKKNSPNLYYVMKVLGKEECDRRIESVINSL